MSLWQKYFWFLTHTLNRSNLTFLLSLASRSRKKLGYFKTQEAGYAYVSAPQPLINKGNKVSRIVTSKQITLFDKSFLWSTFQLFWEVTRPKGNHFASVHGAFSLFFPTNYKKSHPFELLNIEYYFSRWVLNYNFLYNLAFANAGLQLLTHKIFIEESLVFNWRYNRQNFKIFKFIQPYFSFSDLPHGEFIRKTLPNIITNSTDAALVISLKSHERLLRYLQKAGLYLIGLVPTNYAPWKVSYPILVFSDSKLVQLFFFRWLLAIRTQAEISRYKTLITLWQSI